MPYYEYICCKCNHTQEEKHGMSEKPLVVCKACKEYTCSKVITSPSVTGGKGGGEISDYGDIHDYKPEYLRFKDGHREKFDPAKHGHRKGRGR